MNSALESIFPFLRKKNVVTTPAEQASLLQFQKKYPDYESTKVLDEIRKKEFARLDSQHHVYLDFTGGGLYAQSQIDRHMEMLRSGVFGNPHSSNPTSHYSTEVTESARNYVLQYFNTTNEEYRCVFTLNASGALKLLGEAYPFEKEDHFLLTYDNHNSVNGIREFAHQKGAGTTYVEVTPAELRINEEVLIQQLNTIQGNHKLFAFPAQSNVSGVKHDLVWIEYAQKLGWDVLLDAAAFVPSNRLDLQTVKPDFVSISFYKMFGYPTGIGCLLIKNDKIKKLHRPWFAGGTVSFVSVMEQGFSFAEFESQFEDGTINYLNIPAVEIGLKWLESIGIQTIQKRITILTDYLIQSLSSLKHKNGKPLVQIYGPGNIINRGGTVIMNLFDNEGKRYLFSEIERMANLQKISLRTGCFCNPGLDETISQITRERLQDFVSCNMKQFSHAETIHFFEKERGSVRVSFGYVSNFHDVNTFLNFVMSLLNKKIEEAPQENVPLPVKKTEPQKV